jgi:hypothetical protein
VLPLTSTRSYFTTLAAALGTGVLLYAAPSVYPTGVTIFDPAKAWNGYTVLSPLGGQAAIVIDMNGNIVKQWDGYVSSAGGPVRILPGGVVMGAAGAVPGKQESMELVQRDFAGAVQWSFNHNEQLNNGTMDWATRQHHDWQRSDFPAGYYSPGINPTGQAAKTLLLTHTTRVQPKVMPNVALDDDRIIEIAPDGKVLWEWIASDHIDEFRFSAEARASMAARGTEVGPGAAKGAGAAKAKGKAAPRAIDWLHVNSATYLGPNRWFDAGDRRFAPDNVIISSREASLVAIIARDGSIAWQLGPDFLATPEVRAIRQIIGQHHAHFIPKGLPGAGNLMIFDNGGASGYGPASGIAPNGTGVFVRPTSRVLEIDPTTLRLVWNYTAPTFFATNISGAQRLENGNTLITEGPSGRIFEVTTAGDIVWEYVYPKFGAGARPTNSVYRAYRLPYAWIPQFTHAQERAVKAPAPGDYRLQ